MAEPQLKTDFEAAPGSGLLIAFCLFKYFPYGGLQRDFLEIALRCRDLGYRVRVYTQHWEGPRPAGLEILEMPSRQLTNHGRSAGFAVRVQDHLDAFPVDLVVGFNKMPGLDVYYAGDSCYVEKAHSHRPWFYRLLPRYRVLSQLENAVFGERSNTLIMMIAPRQIPFFQRHHLTPESRLVRLPPGIAPERIQAIRRAPVNPALRLGLQIPAADNLLLFVGSGFHKKGLDRVIRAFAALPEALRLRSHLCVLGEDHDLAFRRLAGRLQVAGRVRFLGGRDDVPDFLATADALLLPALDENAGIVILEALFAGLPLIVTDVCGFAEHVQRADAGIVLPSPFRQSAFDRALVELLHSPRRTEWRDNGRSYARSRDLRSLHTRATEIVSEAVQRKARRRQLPLLAFCLYKYFPWGGQQRDMLRIAQACIERGFRIRVYAMSWEGARPEGIEFVPVPVFALSNHRRYEKYHDWVQGHLARHPAALVIGFNKQPDLDVYFAADSCYEDKARRMRGRLYRMTGRYASLAGLERAVFQRGGRTQVLALTEVQKRVFQSYYDTEESRFEVLPPGVAAERKRPENADAIRVRKRAELGLRERDLLLLLVGSGFVTKGLDRALVALQRLPGDLAERTRLVVIGQDKAAPFRRLAQRLGVADRVEFLGGRDDVIEYMLAADVLVHPAYAESAGIVLLEAVISGLPVLVTSVCGYASHVAASGCGQVIPEPFEQDTMDGMLRDMLRSPDRGCWSDRGVAYGESQALFDLPGRAAALIASRYEAEQERRHDGRTER